MPIFVTLNDKNTVHKIKNDLSFFFFFFFLMFVFLLLMNSIYFCYFES
jgi:hypothetical protein